ncbi:MAG: glycosyltransferase family 9 protein, partial [Ignavibacteria bacterium]|nr:glycosyltransferase family 9 protein [Ignavibacteria bacterium]
KQLVDKNLLASNKNIVLCDTSDNIHKLGAILEKSKLLICNDSGVRHLAATLKIKTITLFPEDKIDSWKFYTDEEKQYFIVGKRNLDDPANSYLDGINVSEVIQKAEELLNDK